MSAKTASKTQTDTAQATDADGVVARITALNEEGVEHGRKGRSDYLQSYEQAVEMGADWQTQLAEATKVEWVAEMAHVQATVNRDVARLYTGAARELLSA